MTLYEQFREFTTIRANDEFWDSVGLGVGRGVLRRIERARQSFYRRCKNGDKPGYPKYRASRRYKTIEIDNPTPGMVTNRRGKWVVKVRGLPILVLRPRARSAGPEGAEDPDHNAQAQRECTSLWDTRWAGKPFPQPAGPLAWTWGFPPASRSRTERSSGVGRRPRAKSAELAAAHLALQEELRRPAQGCAPNSRRLRHRETRPKPERVSPVSPPEIVRNHDLIAIEDLGIVNMTRSARGTVERPGRNVSAKSGLNRSISEQSWGIIVAQLAYKAEWYGRTLVRVGPPAHLSDVLCVRVSERRPSKGEAIRLWGLRSEHGRGHKCGQEYPGQGAWEYPPRATARTAA